MSNGSESATPQHLVLGRDKHRSQEQLEKMVEGALSEPDDEKAVEFREHVQSVMAEPEVRRAIRDRILAECSSVKGQATLTREFIRIASETKKGKARLGALHLHNHMMSDWTPEELKAFAETGVRPARRAG